MKPHHWLITDLCVLGIPRWEVWFLPVAPPLVTFLTIVTTCQKIPVDVQVCISSSSVCCTRMCLYSHLLLLTLAAFLKYVILCTYERDVLLKLWHLICSSINWRTSISKPLILQFNVSLIQGVEYCRCFLKVIGTFWKHWVIKIFHRLYWNKLVFHGKTSSPKPLGC